MDSCVRSTGTRTHSDKAWATHLKAIYTIGDVEIRNYLLILKGGSSPSRLICRAHEDDVGFAIKLSGNGGDMNKQTTLEQRRNTLLCEPAQHFEEERRRHQQNLASLRRIQIQVKEWEERASHDTEAADALRQVSGVLRIHKASFEQLRAQLMSQLERKKTAAPVSGVKGNAGGRVSGERHRVRRYV
jgi:hypothetical protein